MITKNPLFVESGREGARRRWGPPRVVRLDDLNADQRRLVVSLIENMGTKKAAPADASAGAAIAEGHDHDRSAG